MGVDDDYEFMTPRKFYLGPILTASSRKLNKKVTRTLYSEVIVIWRKQKFRTVVTIAGIIVLYLLYCIVLYYIYMHLYSASCIAHHSEALPV